MPKLQEYQASCQKIFPPKLEVESPRITLDEYCETNAVASSPIECARLVNGARHGKAVRAVWRLLLDDAVHKTAKKSAAWVVGRANSGKSEFIRRLRRLFASAEVDFRGAYLPVRLRNLSKIREQLVTCEEFNNTHGFSKDQLHVTKLLFEGQGASVRPDLYKPFTPGYEDAVFVVASNRLPAQEAHKESLFQQDVWNPICTRTEFIYLMHSFPNGTQASFPYTQGQLAQTLQLFCRYPDLVRQMDELDGVKVPEFESFEC